MEMKIFLVLLNQKVRIISKKQESCISTAWAKLYFTSYNNHNKKRIGKIIK
jgi:hypothetical protein